jgi:hypothetical protein
MAALVALAAALTAAGSEVRDCAHRPSHPGVCFNFDDLEPPKQADGGHKALLVCPPSVPMSVSRDMQMHGEPAPLFWDEG